MLTPFLRLNIYCCALLFLSIFLIQPSSISFAQSDDTTSSKNIVLILDASGSMWGQVEGENKITIAKKVMTDLVEELPENTNVSLIAYGHRQKGDCGDIETLVDLGPLDKKDIAQKIEALNAKGKTPITDSVLLAFDQVRAGEDAATVILVSDGIETCGGDPCETVRKAKDEGVNFVMHVVGFDVGDVDVSQLECAAQAGGGLYLSAKNASELSEALETAVDMPAELPTGKLSVKVTAEGKLQDSIVLLTNTNTNEELKGQRTYSSEKTNPRVIPLPDGIYDLEVKPVGLKGVKSRTFEGIEIKEGEVVEKEVDFSFGELSVKVVRNEKLSDATIHIYDPETEEVVAQNRSYTNSKSNPKVFELTPGTYDVEVKSIEIKGSPTERINAVEITSGETVEHVIDFSSGTLNVGAFQGEKFVDAIVYIKNAETDELVGQSRTYKSSKSNPKAFELLPGVYNIEVKALGINTNPIQKFEAVEITAAEPQDLTAQFESGVLKVGAFEGEKFLDSAIRITDTKTGEVIVQGRTYTNAKSNPKMFELPPGVYDIEVEAQKIEGDPTEKFEAVQISPSEPVEKIAQFTTGTLIISAVQGEKLLDSSITITNATTGEKIAQSRTYTNAKSNPKEFMLLPGSYTVTVKAQKIEGNPEKTFEFELGAQQTVEKTADFSE